MKSITVNQLIINDDGVCELCSYVGRSIIKSIGLRKAAQASEKSFNFDRREPERKESKKAKRISFLKGERNDYKKAQMEELFKAENEAFENSMYDFEYAEEDGCNLTEEEMREYLAWYESTRTKA